MSKEIVHRNKTRLICGQARPGAKLAFLKNMALFTNKFNNETKNRNGELVNVEITVYKDGSHEYSISTPPSIYLLKNRRSDYQELRSKDDKKTARGKERKEISEAELEKIARAMLPSLNTDDIEKAKKIVKGTARSFGSDFKINK